MAMVVLEVMEEDMVLGLSMDSEVMAETLATEDTALVVMAVMEEALDGVEALDTEDMAVLEVALAGVVALDTEDMALMVMASDGV